MDHRSRALATQRQRLQQRSAVLRERLAHQTQQLQPALDLAEQARDAGRWLRANPALVAGLVAALVVLRPRRLLRWGLRAWAGWRLLGRARSWLERFQRGA